MAEFSIRFAGFGGQGIITAGYLLGLAATIYAGKNALQSQSYGPEARGGASRCDVIISDEPISKLSTKTLDVLVAMSQEGYNRYRGHVKPDGIIIYDEHLVKVEKEDEPKSIPVPATKVAMDLGSKIMANIVMLGSLSTIKKIVSPEALKEAIKAQFPRHVDANMRAFEEGVKRVEQRR
ncbi:MAG: 2-oxoacid:acceptor oxidoreductase family protein [Nitrososphaerota archaeon]